MWDLHISTHLNSGTVVMSTVPTPQKAFFTRLSPGIRRRNLAAFYFIAFMTICLASVINMLQPFMLSEFLHCVGSEQS